MEMIFGKIDWEMSIHVIDISNATKTPLDTSQHCLIRIGNQSKIGLVS
jgi:hypothetical protein